MQLDTNIIGSVEQHVVAHFSQKMPEVFVYHDLQHTRNVVGSIMEIVEGYKLSDKELELLILAAWFHDTGYDKGAKDHEERSCQYARNFLQQFTYTEEELDVICGCIMATKLPQTPHNLLEQIIGDADMSHLGKKNYWDRCGRVRQEIVVTQNRVMSEQEWVDFEVAFMTKHQYHTSYAKELYDNRKEKHIRQLRKQKLRLNPKEILSPEEKGKRNKKKKKKKKALPPIEKKQAGKNGKQDINVLNLSRGVETMYRTTYRTHVNLSSIADNKANIMLSINAIIISIIVSTLVPQFEINRKLILPTLILLVVCLSAMVLAILSTRPKITEGKFTREDIQKRKSNLLFFGNFYNMKLDDFQWGMMEMIRDKDFLYSSMTRDIYFLGVVLAKKYRYLRYCYSIFMYGLIIAVVAFAISFLT